jgi:hypothetical protein
VEDDPDTTRAVPPGAHDLLPLLGVAPAVTAVAWWVDPAPVVGFWSALGVAAGAAGVFGIPALYWALDHQRASAGWLAGLGAVAASLFPCVLLVSGMTGQWLLGGRRYAGLVVSRAAPIPVVGQIPWSRFAVLIATCMAIGALSGVIYALARQRFSRRTHVRA